MAAAKKVRKPRKKGKHYIDNKLFTAAVAEYVAEYKRAKEEEESLPMMSNYIGDCFLKIATRLASRPNFANYSFKDEMIFDGIENSLMYIHNFNPEKSSNAFSYFTQIIYFAFLRRIQLEKKQLYIRYKQTKNMVDLSDNSVIEKYDHNTYHVESFYQDDYDQTMTTFIENFERGIENKKRKVQEKKNEKKNMEEKGNNIVELLKD